MNVTIVQKHTVHTYLFFRTPIQMEYLNGDLVVGKFKFTDVTWVEVTAEEGNVL